MSDQKRIDEQKQMKRRDFLSRAAAAGGAVAAAAATGCAAVVGTPPGPGSASRASGDAPVYEESLANAPELRQVGGVKRVKHKGKDFFIVRKSRAEVVALDNTCSHKSCRTKFNAEEASFECPCHASTFDLNGNALSGPAVNSGPLKKYSARLSGETVNVTLDS